MKILELKNGILEIKNCENCRFYSYERVYNDGGMSSHHECYIFKNESKDIDYLFRNCPLKDK
jgi:hypothetical protein